LLILLKKESYTAQEETGAYGFSFMVEIPYHDWILLIAFATALAQYIKSTLGFTLTNQL